MKLHFTPGCHVHVHVGIVYNAHTILLPSPKNIQEGVQLWNEM